jgi:pyridoxine kinase
MSTGETDLRRVLSIQSHTVRGYVGNKAAVFPLQLLGVEVDAVNSVQFSNHTGYGAHRGDVLDGQQLTALLDGLAANGLLAGSYSHLLTGYIGSLSFLRAVVAAAGALRRANPALCYVCDPVLGDSGRLYVPAELVSAYRDELVPLAQVLTPNWFEAELLTGFPVRGLASALAACNALHALGPHTVIITSLEEEVDGAPVLTLVGSTRTVQAAGCPARFALRVPRLAGYFTGTGDLTAALLLARTAEAPGRLAAAAEMAVAGVQAVLRRTVAAAAAAGPDGGPSARELRLVQSADELRAPVVTHRAFALDDDAQVLSAS